MAKRLTWPVRRGHETTLRSILQRDDVVVDVRDTRKASVYLREDERLAPDGGFARLVNVGIASGALVLAAPAMLVVAALVRVSSRGPIVFKQERIGVQGKPFMCLKFRTMFPDADERLNALLASDADLELEWLAYRKLQSDPRVTRVGRLLRRTSFDELPQLWNVARGEMNLVGPRPIVESEMELYGPDLSEVLSVRPGLTGLWQVSGRNDLTFAERVVIDLEYIRRRSTLGDIRICFRTLSTLARGSGRGAY